MELHGLPPLLEEGGACMVGEGREYLCVFRVRVL